MKENFELDEKFLKTTYDDWATRAKADLKSENLEKLLHHISIEEVDFFPLQDHLEMSFELKTFPEKTLETKYLFKFAQNDKKLIGHDKSVSEFFCEGNEFYAPNENDFKDEENCFYRLNLESVEDFRKNIFSKANILIDISGIHNAGGSIIDELTLFTLLFLEVAKKDQNLLKRSRLLVSISSNFFQEISKLRSLRYIAEGILESENINAKSFEIHAISSLREQTIYDPWVNLLRNTTSSEAAIIGGANFVSTFGEDIIFRYLGQEESALSEKLSRNIPKVLLEESLLGFVKDPSHGSFLIENLTMQMVQKSWEKARLIKELNQKTISVIASEVKNTSEKRLQAVRKRKFTLTGINNFSNPEDKIHGLSLISFEANLKGLFPLRRTAREFEVLRFQVEKLKKEFKGKVVVYKNAAKLSARTTFSQNYFELLGMSVSEKIVNSIDELNTELSSDEDVKVVVALDDDYSHLVEKIKAKGSLYLAGKLDLSAELLKSKNIEDCIYMGQDVYQTLFKLVEKWEGKDA